MRTSEKVFLCHTRSTASSCINTLPCLGHQSLHRRNKHFGAHVYEGKSPYRNRSTASQASFPPSKLHPIGPTSHSAQIRNFTFPFASAIPGAVDGSVMDDGREKPIFSKAMGEPRTCQSAVVEEEEEGEGEGEMIGEGGNGESPPEGIYARSERVKMVWSRVTAPPSATTHSPTPGRRTRLPHA